jgi:hypothetical protein
MKAKIDEFGELWLERSGKMKLQYCPFRHFMSSCGDHCPLFEINLYKNKLEKVHRILLCKKTYFIELDNFIDKRPK